MKKVIYTASFVSILVIAAAIIILYQFIIDISVIPENDTSAYKEEALAEQPGENIVYFGVISRFSPRLIYEGYQPVMDYLSKETPYHFKLKLSDSYDETIRQVHDGKVTFAFVGTYIYVKARENYDIICILKPLNRQGKPFFRSALVTRKDSLITSIKDLVGKRIAVPSSASFSANWLAYYELPKNNIKINKLDTLHFFNYHHTVIYEILKSKFDAGAVKDRVAAEFSNRNITVLEYSDPIPSSPIVMNHNTDKQLVQSVKKALLKIDQSQEYYRKLTQNWDPELIYGFQEASDNDYDEAELLIKSFGLQ